MAENEPQETSEQPVENSEPTLKDRLPGVIAVGILTIITSFWMFWSFGELYFEGWGQPLPYPLYYLIPGGICFVLTLIAVLWPRFGGWVLIGVGAAFAFWWLPVLFSRGLSGIGSMLVNLFLSGGIALTGVFFLLEHRYRIRFPNRHKPEDNWFRRHSKLLIATGIPLGVAVGASINSLPTVINRLDDGNRGARLIEGNGVTLIWAPAGPGWTKGSREVGQNLSWDQIALYGMEPVGFGNKPGFEKQTARQAQMDSTCLCAYLNEAGTELMPTRQGIWRMPTTDEVVRSLVSNGTNAGCVWDTATNSARCKVTPDKETPLWAPDYLPVYYWTADEYDSTNAYYVSYNGSAVRVQPKQWGNPRHGYRCVKEPPENDSVTDTSSTNQTR